MKRFRISVLAVVAISGLALVVTATAASAQGTTVNSVVGRSPKVKLGAKGTFAPASCTSASPSVVACGTVGNVAARTPQDAVQLWCLAPTPPDGTTVTVDYQANGPESPIPATTLTVNCIEPPVKEITAPGSLSTRPLSGNFGVTSCSTDVLGTSCQFAGKNMQEVCSLAVTAYALPITVSATVTLEGPAPINGKTVTDYFVCA